MCFKSPSYENQPDAQTGGCKKPHASAWGFAPQGNGEPLRADINRWVRNLLALCLSARMAVDHAAVQILHFQFDQTVEKILEFHSVYTPFTIYMKVNRAFDSYDPWRS